MSCQVSREQLWSWIDREAPELAAHLEGCPLCRARTEEIRAEIGMIASDTEELRIPLPERIGAYAIQKLIGEGGQALVYEAIQDSPRRPVAVKVLKAGRFLGTRELRRFRHEIQAMAALNHPSIASIFEAGQTTEGSPYIAMELVRGTPLHIFLREKQPSVRRRLEIFCQVCDAVAYAHRQGVIHRDLKPSNILIDEGGNPQVLDFGLARIIRPDSPLTVTESGLVEGTPRYMSPEMICGGAGHVDARSDVYALGVVLYEMLAGQPPFDIASLTPESMRVICEEDPPRASSFDPALRGDLDAILAHALEKQQQNRYPTVEALALDVRKHLGGASVRIRGVPMRARARKTLTRHRLVLVVSGVIAAGLLLGLSVWVHPSSDRDDLRHAALELHLALLQEPEDATRSRRALAALERFNGLDDAILVVSVAQGRSREYRFAIDLLQAEIDRDPTAWPMRVLLAEIYTELGRTQEAKQVLSHPAMGLPVTAEAWYLRSLATLDPGRAKACLEECLRLEPGHRLALESLALQSERAGDHRTAASAMGRLASVSEPGDAWAGRRAGCLLRLGRNDEAIATLDSILTTSPDVASYYHYRAVAHRRKKEYVESVRDYTRAVEVSRRESERAWVYYHRAAILWILGRKEEAVADFRRAFTILGYASFGNARLYVLLAEMGREGEAREALAEARRSQLQEAWLSSVLACLAGELSPEDLVARADPSQPQQVCEACYYAGETSRLAGRSAEARVWFQKSLDTGCSYDPRNPMEPMTESELAQWRLESYRASTTFPGPTLDPSPSSR